MDINFDKLVVEFGRQKAAQGMGIDGALLLAEFVEFLKEAAQQSVQPYEVHAERIMSMSCPSCHRIIEVVLRASLRQ